MFLESKKRNRFAIYTRYSSEMQNELSLEAQEARCRQSILDRTGVVVSVFNDSAGAAGAWSVMDSRSYARRPSAANLTP